MDLNAMRQKVRSLSERGGGLILPFTSTALIASTCATGSVKPALPVAPSLRNK